MEHLKLKMTLELGISGTGERQSVQHFVSDFGNFCHDTFTYKYERHRPSHALVSNFPTHPGLVVKLDT